LIGRPRTATFRLLDLIGIDIMATVGENLYPRIPGDETRELLRDPNSAALIASMVEKGWLGNKSDAGFYRESRTAEGRAYWPLDLTTLEHRPPQPAEFPSLATIGRERDLTARLRALVGLDDRAGRFVRAILGNLLGYASRRLPEIADDVRSVDDAMRWGFSHELGPFQIWDALGIAPGQRLAAAADLPGTGPAHWVDEMVASGRSGFYASDSATPGASPSSWNVATRAPAASRETADRLELASRRAVGGTLAENAAASLIDLGDGVAALELHSKMNVLDGGTLELLQQSLDRVARDFAGLVVTGRGENFSAGADIRMIASLVESSRLDEIDRVTKAMQDAFMAVRFSPKPVVVTPFGWTLGGGAEFTMAGARIAAAAESYVGQTEVGIGWIPAAGGCKELLRRVVSPVAALPQGEPAAVLEKVFDLITQGKVSGSAQEAREWGFLAPNDRIVMNRDHVLAAAKREVLALADSGYRPPERGKTVYAAGRDALAALKIRAYIFRQGGYASDHDVALANQIAYVLCGGDLSEPQWVDEQYILDLERAAIRELSQLPKTRERIKHFLETGKTLRN
jgi:3-hydroxyacyl-CoA dehydrogenase